MRLLEKPNYLEAFYYKRVTVSRAFNEVNLRLSDFLAKTVNNVCHIKEYDARRWLGTSVKVRPPFDARLKSAFGVRSSLRYPFVIIALGRNQLGCPHQAIVKLQTLLYYQSSTHHPPHLHSHAISRPKHISLGLKLTLFLNDVVIRICKSLKEGTFIYYLSC